MDGSVPWPPARVRQRSRALSNTPDLLHGRPKLVPSATPPRACPLQVFSMAVSSSSLPPRLVPSPKSKSHAQPARGSLQALCIYRRKIQSKTFRSDFKTAYRLFFQTPSRQFTFVHPTMHSCSLVYNASLIYFHLPTQGAPSYTTHIPTTSLIRSWEVY
jgi:hypothetical protein